MTNGVASIKDILFEELELGVRTAARLISRIDSEQWEFRPSERMRTLRELVQHLAAIPDVDVAISKEATEPEIRNLEKEYKALGSDHSALSDAMQRGLEQLKLHYGSMLDEEFLNHRTKPFYVDHEQLQSKWLVETTTHFFHHRSQLYQYLKQLGHDVNMMDLYVV